MKRTAKYVAAETVALKAGLTFQNQTDLYDQLAKLAYMWDSKAGQWLYLPFMDADEPSPLIKVRVWANKKHVEEVALDIIVKMQDYNYELLERSEVYACRPPKHKEGRVYLVFENQDRK